jgi:Na+-driven multidrug efflux pump
VENFSAEWGGWRYPFWISILLVGVSVLIRMRMSESPMFTKLKSEGKTSTNPLKESFGKKANFKMVLLALFGAVMGQGVVWYTGQFYAQSFIETVCKIDFIQSRNIMLVAILMATPCFVLFGWFLGREMNWVMLLMSIVGNGSNVLLDYLMISKWGWASAGAGLATALSQYLALIVGLIWMFFTIPWQAVPAAIQELFDWVALKETFALKGNILIRFLVLISVYSIFTNLSATMGTTVLAQNGLLLQIALLSQFTIQGVGVTMQTLTANFKSKGNTQQIIPLLIVSLVTSVVIAVGFAGTSIFFPDQVFGL